jgi:nucleoside-diphosphate-sugar epimerase
MKPEKLLIIGSSGLIGKALFRFAQNNFLSVVGVGSDFVINFESGMRVHSNRKDKFGWADLDPHLDADTLVINAAWGRNTAGDRNSEIHMEFAERELELINKVNGRILNYVSLGSIAEIGDSKISPSNKTLYSKAKKSILYELQESGIPHLWIRLASIYGQNDKRDWLMNQLIAHTKSTNRIELQFPDQVINLCQVDSLAQEIIKIQGIKRNTSLNFYTKQWVTVGELANSFELFKEPIISKVDSPFFTENDSSGHLIETPPILNFIRSSTDRE